MDYQIIIIIASFTLVIGLHLWLYLVEHPRQCEITRKHNERIEHETQLIADARAATRSYAREVACWEAALNRLQRGKSS